MPKIKQTEVIIFLPRKYFDFYNFLFRRVLFLRLFLCCRRFGVYIYIYRLLHITLNRSFRFWADFTFCFTDFLFFSFFVLFCDFYSLFASAAVAVRGRTWMKWMKADRHAQVTKHIRFDGTWQPSRHVLEFRQTEFAFFFNVFVFDWRPTTDVSIRFFGDFIYSSVPQLVFHAGFCVPLIAIYQLVVGYMYIV